MNCGILSAISLVLLSSLTTAQAQEQKPAEPKPAAEEKATDSNSEKKKEEKKTKEVIRVTGSRIKQIDVATAVPVTTYTREDIDRSGQPTVADFIRNKVPSGNMSSENQTLSQSNGGSSFGGRDFDPSYTLVLVNGRRLPSNAIASDSVDLNLIPLAAVERIEYLTDGASAIYGSDAVAGVLNIITRKNFSGTSVNSRVGMGTEHNDGVETSLQIVSGTQSGKSNFLIAADMFKREAVQATNRPLQKSSISPDGTDSRSPTGFPGYVQRTEAGAKAQTKAFSDCPEGSLKPDNKCYFDTAPLYQVNPKTVRESIYTIFDNQLTDSVKFSGEARYSRTSTDIRNGAAPGQIRMTGAQWNDLPADVKALSPFFDPENPGRVEADDTQFVIGRRFVEFGPRATTALNENFSLVGSLNGQIFDDINWEFSIASHKLKNLQYGVDGNLDSTKVIDYFKTGVFNPFVLNTFDTQDKIDAKEDAVTEIFRLGESNLDVYTLAFDGDLPLKLNGGSAGFAAGLELRKEKYFDQADSISQETNRVIGSAGGVGGGGQETKAGFLELGLPILPNLEFKAAVRNDSISSTKGEANAKSTSTYHASVSYSPIDLVKIRSSYGTGFKPAALHDRFLSLSTGVQRASDYEACAEEGIAEDDCTPREINSRSGGNPDLDPERSAYYNFGILVQPLASLAVSADYWHLEIKDKIDSLSVQQILNNAAKYPDLVKRNPATGGFDGADYYVASNLQNLNKNESAGAEISVNYGEKFEFGRVESGLKLNKVLVSKTQDTPVDPLCDYAKNSKGADGSLSLDLLTKSYSVGSSLRYYAPFESTSGGVKSGTCNLVDPDTKFTVKHYAELGLNVGYTAPFGTDFGLGMQNVTNAAPAYDRNAQWPWFSRSRYSNMGRTVFLTVGHTFQ